MTPDLNIQITPAERAQWKPTLIEELPGFLNRCERAFAVRNNGFYNIDVNEETKRLMLELTSDSVSIEEELFGLSGLRVDPEGVIQKPILTNLLKNTLRLKMRSNEWNDFIKLLKKKGLKDGKKAGERVWRGLSL